MEEPCTSNSGRKHRALTPLRLLRGVICLLVLLLTAFMMLVCYGFVSAVLVRFFSLNYSRKATAFIFGAWLAMWPLLFEKINRTKVVISGDNVPAKERVLLIANHRTEVDWMYLWDLALRKGRLGYIKYVLKSSLMKLPVFGWAFHVLEFISVERKWEVDESTFRHMLSTFRNPRDPLWLALFPEGTDFTEKKCVRSQKYAAENGFPVLKSVLLPKSKGFYACLHHLRDSLDAVYDVTIGYKHNCPSLMDNVFGVDPAEVHLHIRRISLDDIPKSEDRVSAWLMDTFRLKDQMLSEFYNRGYFSKPEIRTDLPTARCLLTAAAVLTCTAICTYLTVSGPVYFKIYVALVCAYLGSATRLNFRPQPLL
uniref:1-acylglycerol-3-phosphate O-acyltransferase n=1 Tax=Kalanchoe fedtschenkoi TaxID=63787 RepID=A0A7N0T251_KALFE